MADYVRPPLQFTLTLGQVWGPTVEYIFRETTSAQVDKGSRDDRVQVVMAALDTAYGKLKAHYLQDISTKTWAP